MNAGTTVIDQRCWRREVVLTSAVAERHSLLDDLINAIGTAAFPERFAHVLREPCGAECAFTFVAPEHDR